MKALHLKILLSHYFDTFFNLHKLQLCSYRGKFWHIRYWDQNKQKTPFLFFPILPLIIFYWIFRTPCLLRPPVYSGPTSGYLNRLAVFPVSRYSNLFFYENLPTSFPGNELRWFFFKLSGINLCFNETKTTKQLS